MAAWMIEATRRGSPGAANRALERLRAVFNKAEDWGHRPPGSNPCHKVPRNRRRKMERFLNENEFRRLGEVLERYRDNWPVHAAALQLLLLTGCRKSEIVELRWREVRGARLYLDDSKTGARTVQLGRDAAALLAALRRGKPDDFVFAQPSGRPVSLEKFWSGLRIKADLVGVRMHDLRHSYASQAARLSLPLPITKRLLGHRDIESTARYTHYDDGHLIQVADAISRLIESAAKG